MLENAKIIKKGIVVKAKKFIRIKDFFINLINEQYNGMNYLIEYCSLVAISEKIKNGYILDKKQDMLLSEKLNENYKYIKDVEKLFQAEIPEKYIYQVFFKNLEDILKKNEQKIYDLPLTNGWLIKQDKNKIAIKFFNYWIESMEGLLKENSYNETIKNKINQFENYQEYLEYLPENNKQEVVNFLEKISTKSIWNKSVINYIKQDIKLLISLVNKIEKSEVKKDNIAQILKKLKEQKEHNVYTSLIELEHQYIEIFVHNNAVEINQKNTMSKIYHHYLCENLNDYLNIKKNLRHQNRGTINPEKLVLEIMKEIKENLNIISKQINDENLSLLTSKNEYFATLKRQW